MPSISAQPSPTKASQRTMTCCPWGMSCVTHSCALEASVGLHPRVVWLFIGGWVMGQKSHLKSSLRAEVTTVFSRSLNTKNWHLYDVQQFTKAFSHVVLYCFYILQVKNWYLKIISIFPKHVFAQQAPCLLISNALFFHYSSDVLPS